MRDGGTERPSNRPEAPRVICEIRKSAPRASPALTTHPWDFPSLPAHGGAGECEGGCIRNARAVGGMKWGGEA